MADETPESAPDWSPPKTDPETGFALQGDFPLNSRLRAEAMAQAGVSEDPERIVTPELIADAGDRLERDRKAAEDAARKAPSEKWSEKRLREHAETLSIGVAPDADKPAILAAIEGAPAPQTEV